MPAVALGAVLPAALAVLLGVLSAIRPRWALAALLAVLPFFAHQLLNPAGPWLVAFVAAVEAGYAVRVAPRWRAVWRDAGAQPLLVLGALFVTAAILSLSSLPLVAIWQQHAAMLRTLPASAWPGQALDWLKLPETAREFSITSAFLALQGFVFSVVVWRETQQSPRTALGLAWAITAGLVAFVGAGLLEGLGLVRLDMVRGDVGVSVRVGSVQSTAGNPGWFAQVVVYALPYALVVLYRRTRPLARLAAVGTVAATSALALILAFQRGGWIAGAIVLAYLAIAASRLVATPGGPDRWPRRALAGTSLLFGVAAALAIGAAWVWIGRVAPENDHLSPDAYVERFRSIRDADRLPYVSASLRIAALHPFLGGGSDSFAYRYHMYFEDPGGLYARSGIHVPLATSAHNVFLQTLSGRGLAGFLALVGMFLTAAWQAWRTLGRLSGERDDDRARRLALLMAGGSLLGVAAYGMVQEVFYVHALRLLFFVAVGIVSGASADVAWPARISRALWLTLAALFACHLVYEYVRPGPDRLLRSTLPTGLFAEELDPGHRPFQWTTDEATWPVPPNARHWTMDVRSLAPFPQRVEIAGCTRATGASVLLDDHAWRTVGGRLAGCGPGGRLKLRVTPAWRPSRDDRLLGAMTASVEFR